MRLDTKQTVPQKQLSEAGGIFCTLCPGEKEARVQTERNIHRNLELNDSVDPLHMVLCGNLTCLFFVSNNGQQKEGTEANH